MTFGFARSLRMTAVSVALGLAAVPITARQSPTPVAPAQALAMKGYPALGMPPVITVVKAGAAPRTQFRYVIPVNQKARVDVTVNMSLAITSGVGNVVSKDNQTMPTMKVTVDLGVTSVGPNGDITYDLAVSGMTLEPGAGVKAEVTRGLQPFVALATSIKGSATVSSSGVMKSMRLDVVDPAIRTVLGNVITAIEHLSVPFPDEAVGVGARWEVWEAMEAGGLTTFRPTVFQKAEYEVVSIDGSTVSLQVKTELAAPPQALNSPSLPLSNQGTTFGAENRLQKMSGSGTGTVVVHLDSLVPVREQQSTTSMAMTMTMSVGDGAAAMTVDGKLTADGKLTVTIAPSGMAPAPDKTSGLTALRGVKSVNIGGTSGSTVGPDRVCYPRAASDPRGNFAGVSIAMGGLLAAAIEVLKAGGVEASPRSTDFLKIDAQIHDAAQCKATITLTLTRGLGKTPVIWERTFEITGEPAGFSSRVIDRLKLDVRDFVSDVAKANAGS